MDDRKPKSELVQEHGFAIYDPNIGYYLVNPDVGDGHSRWTSCVRNAFLFIDRDAAVRVLEGWVDSYDQDGKMVVREVQFNTTVFTDPEEDGE